MTIALTIIHFSNEYGTLGGTRILNFSYRISNVLSKSNGASGFPVVSGAIMICTSC